MNANAQIAAEPSMEDILASIRRIIADDDSFSARPRRRSEETPAERKPALVAVAPVSIAGLSGPNPEPAWADAEPEPEPGDEASSAEERHAHASSLDRAEQGSSEDEQEEEEPRETAGPLVSPDAAASVTAQFQMLAASMILNDSGLLQEYAREMLRPMLKAWLDDNLPALVERLVRAEIERVARGARR
jgi:uncharacterized protein